MLKKTLIFTLIFVLLSIQAFADTIFFDVQDHWAKEDIYWATNEVGIFRGYGDYTFRPEKNITRAEFLTILYRSGKNQGIFSDEFSGELTYNDFDIKTWSYSYVLSLNNNLKLLFDESIKNIFEEDNFYPDKEITREEAAILVSLMSTEPISNKSINFTDISRSYTYFNQIQKLYRNNIIIGYNDNTFRPLDEISRAESSRLIKNIYEDMYFHKDIFLNDIRYIQEYKTYFPLFKNYDYSQNTEMDDQYIKAVSTLEYLNFGGYIFPGDEHLYDKTPIKTLTFLQNNEYENNIGTKYYILKYGKLEKDSKVTFSERLLQLLYKNEDLTHRSKILVLNELKNYNKDPNLYAIVVDSLIETTDSINEKFDLYFIKLDYLIKNERLDLLDESEIDIFNRIVEFLLNNEVELEENIIEEINNLKKEEKFNIIVKYKLNESLKDYTKGNFELGYEKLYETYEFLKNEEEYAGLIETKEKTIIGALKQLKSMY